MLPSLHSWWPQKLFDSIEAVAKIARYSESMGNIQDLEHFASQWSRKAKHSAAKADLHVESAFGDKRWTMNQDERRCQIIDLIIQCGHRMHVRDTR